MARRLYVLSIAVAALALPMQAALGIGVSAHSMPYRASVRGHHQALLRACMSKKSPYTKSIAVLKACGDIVSPLRQVKSLPGGGKSYLYMVAGHKVSMKVPPADFNALAASSGKLREYDLPSKMTLPHHLWLKAMRNLKSVTPPPFLVTLKYATTTYDNNSPNWSGYLATYHTYEFVEANWTEPRIKSSQCSSTSLSIWAGLGGWTGKDLAQVGTAFGVPGITDHEGFWEIYPQNGMTVLPFAATIGQQFIAAVYHYNGYYLFSAVNVYTHKESSFTVNSSLYNGDTADAIAERPTINGKYSYLSNYGTFPVNAAQATYGSTDTWFGDLSNTNLTMLDGSGNTMAVAGPISSNGESWNMEQVSCK